jgi:hypothetical protein
MLNKQKLFPKAKEGKVKQVLSGGLFQWEEGG